MFGYNDIKNAYSFSNCNLWSKSFNALSAPVDLLKRAPASLKQSVVLNSENGFKLAYGSSSDSQTYYVAHIITYYCAMLKFNIILKIMLAH